MRGFVLVGLTATLGVCAGQGIWERRASYPLEATEVSAAAIDGRVYALCGLTAEGATNALFLYDPATDRWTRRAPIPVSGADHCNVAAAGGKLYLLGGLGAVEGGTYEYDPVSDRWQLVAQMPTPRGASGVAAIGSRIYVGGGLAGGRSVAAFEVFDTATRQWTRLPEMPTARAHLTAQAAGGKFYAYQRGRRRGRACRS
jgi:N-acetylneuraminic acid mutarotase